MTAVNQHLNYEMSISLCGILKDRLVDNHQTTESMETKGLTRVEDKILKRKDIQRLVKSLND